MEAKQFTILIADDSKAARKILNYALTKEGFKVIEAVDGHDALKKFVGNEVHLALIDLMMPKLYGWQVCTAFKQRNPQVKVIITTAAYTSTDNTVEWSGTAGIDGYLTKPIRIKEVTSLVKELLRHDEMVNECA